MKSNIKHTLLVGSLALVLGSCNENSWNDQLDGFEAGPQFSNVQTLDYELTDADYEKISKNKANQALATAKGVKDELTAVGKLFYLNDAISPAEYIPNLLRDSTFQYFTLTKGSAINVKYRIAKNLPEEMVAMNAASAYNVTTADYQNAYGSDENYAETFSPKATAAENIPGILKANFASAQTGDYVLVNYNNSNTAPVFGGATPEPGVEYTNVIKDAVSGADIKLTGVVTGVCAQGFVVSDNSGSILVYFGKTYDGSYSIGDQLEIEGSVSAYNLGLQIGSSCTIKSLGKAETVTYPTPKVYTGADIDAAVDGTANFPAIYCQVTGQVTVSSAGYYNLIVEGTSAANVQGSFYQLTDAQKAMLTDGAKVNVYGYFTSRTLSKDGSKYFNILLVDVKPVTAAPKNVKRSVAVIENTAVSALWKFNGSKWEAAKDVCVLQPSDYAAMGTQALTADQAQAWIPVYLQKTYPYATADTKTYVFYNYTGNGSQSFRSVEYSFDGAKWIDTVSDAGVIYETNQFVYKSSGWIMDPSVELLLPRGKNQATSMWFYQAVVDWVAANIPDAGDYVDSYGTAEYYSGCSSYQGNVNINTAYSAVSGNAHYAGMEPAAIERLMKDHFQFETGPGALSILYPNMAPIDGMEPTVTLTFTAWCTGGANVEYTIVFKCVAKGKFEFVSCTWND